MESDILISEIEEAVKHLKLNEIPGMVGISTEIIKLLGHEGVKILHDMWNKIWRTKRWPEDWTRSSQSTKSKKISFISHVSKILLRVIIDQRLKTYLEPRIPPRAGRICQRQRDQ